MKSVLAISLDVLTAGLILLPIVEGIRYGFKRRLLALIALITSAVTGLVLSGLFADDVYDSFFKERMTEKCIEAAGEYDPVKLTEQLLKEYGIDADEQQIRERLSESGSTVQAAEELAQQYGLDKEQAKELAEQYAEQALESAPESVKEAVPDIIEGFGNTLSENEWLDALNAAAESAESGGEFVEQHYVRPIFTAVLRCVLFALFFTLTELVMLIAFMIFRFDIKGDPSNAGDRAAGALLGIVCAAANVVTLAVIMSETEKLSNGFFDLQTLNSKIFLPLFNIIY